MTPEEYVSELCNPGDPVGLQFIQVNQDAQMHGWDAEFVRKSRQLIEDRHKNGAVFPFPKKPRYV